MLTRNLRIRELKDIFAHHFVTVSELNTLPMFRDAAHKAEDIRRFNPGVEAVDMVCHRHDGAIWLVRFWSATDWHKVAVLRPSDRIRSRVAKREAARRAEREETAHFRVGG